MAAPAVTMLDGVTPVHHWRFGFGLVSNQRPRSGSFHVLAGSASGVERRLGVVECRRGVGVRVCVDAALDDRQFVHLDPVVFDNFDASGQPIEIQPWSMSVLEIRDK